MLEGFRPVGHLRALTMPIAFDSVARQLSGPTAHHRPFGEPTGAGRADRAGRAPGVRPAGALARRPASGPAGRVRLRRLHLAEPREGAVEAVAVLDQGEHSWALALRLERHNGSWLCAHVQVV